MTVITPYDQDAAYAGDSDFMDLFNHPEEYPTVLKRLNVLKLYSQTVLYAPDSVLRTIIQFTNAHNIKLAIEIPIVHETDTRCTGEGVALNGAVDTMAERIYSNGGVLAYAAMDEPLDFLFGNEGLGTIQYCLFSTVQGLAHNAGESITVLKYYFPNIEIGDIENGLDSEQVENDWFDAMHAVLGKPLAFFHDDALIDTQHWQDITPGLQALLKQKNISYGVIINGNNADTTNLTWTATAQARFRLYDTLGLESPRYYIFQSWNPVPDHALPETEPGTMTNLIKTTLGL